MRLDLSTVGIDAGNQPRRVAASATRFYAGEPIYSAATYSSGAASVNTVVVLPDAKPVVGTDSFVGIAAKDAEVTSGAVVTAHKTSVTIPIANVTRIRGRAKTVANIDTEAELLGVLNDFVLFDLTATVYTIDETAAANTSGLMIVDGNSVKGTLDVVVDGRALRSVVA